MCELNSQLVGRVITSVETYLDTCPTPHVTIIFNDGAKVQLIARAVGDSGDAELDYEVYDDYPDTPREVRAFDMNDLVVAGMELRERSTIHAATDADEELFRSIGQALIDMGAYDVEAIVPRYETEVTKSTPVPVRRVSDLPKAEGGVDEVITIVDRSDEDMRGFMDVGDSAHAERPTMEFKEIPIMRFQRETWRGVVEKHNVHGAMLTACHPVGTFVADEFNRAQQDMLRDKFAALVDILVDKGVMGQEDVLKLLNAGMWAGSWRSV